MAILAEGFEPLFGLIGKGACRYVVRSSDLGPVAVDCDSTLTLSCWVFAATSSAW